MSVFLQSTIHLRIVFVLIFGLIDDAKAPPPPTASRKHKRHDSKNKHLVLVSALFIVTANIKS